MTELTIQGRDRIVRVSRSAASGWAVSVNGGGPITAHELQQIEAHIGGDEDGQRIVAKLRAKL